MYLLCIYTHIYTHIHIYITACCSWTCWIRRRANLLEAIYIHICIYIYIYTCIYIYIYIERERERYTHLSIYIYLSIYLIYIHMYHSLLLPDLLDLSAIASRGGGESSVKGGRGEELRVNPIYLSIYLYVHIYAYIHTHMYIHKSQPASLSLYRSLSLYIYKHIHIYMYIYMGAAGRRLRRPLGSRRRLRPQASRYIPGSSP